MVQREFRDRLPQHAPANLNHPRPAGISLRKAIGNDASGGSAVERETRVAGVKDVEHVYGVTPYLQLRSFINRDVTEDRSIHVSHSGTVQRVNSQRAI